MLFIGISTKNYSQLALSEYEISKIIRYNDTSIWQSLGDRKLLISCKVIVKAGIKLNKLDFSKCEINETNKMFEEEMHKKKKSSKGRGSKKEQD